MRSMKKTAVRLVSLLVIAAMMFSVAACTGGKGNHEHSYVTEVVAPTCTEAGYTKHICTCGDIFTDNEVPAGHKMLEVVAKAPTCTEDGEAMFYTCSVCGYVDGQKTVIPALGHLYDTTYEYPTANEAGSKTSVCRTCGDTQTQTIDALGITLPEVSEFLVQVIGGFAATLELTKGSELVYVSEVNDPEMGDGFKQSLFVEVAEAVVDSTGEVLKAHLKIKIGFAETTLTGLVPAKDVVVNKNKAEFKEITVFVNGDDVSVAIDNENGNINLSEMVYGTLAQMMGIGGYEELQAILANGRLAQELANLRALLTEGAFNIVVGELGNIDAAYIEHLDELFALLGEEILVASAQNDGTTIYRLNLAALKKLLADVEGKTVAEYLESVYGKNVAAAVAEFIETLPDKKIKDVVNAAVNLADASGIAIGDIYTLIDLYIYTVTGLEFSIESQIADYYDVTLVDLLIEMYGITGADKLVFVTNIKSSCAQFAELVQTVSFEDILSIFIMPGEESVFETLKAVVDALNEQIIFNFTTDAEGNLVAMTLDFAGIEYELEVMGEGMSRITAVLPDGSRMLVTLYADGFSIRVMDVFGTLVASIDFSDTLEVVGEDFVSTCVLSVRDEMNELLNYKHVIVNNVVTELKALLAGYGSYTIGNSYYDPDLDEWIHEQETVTYFATYFDVSYVDYGTEKIFNAVVAETNILVTEKNGKTLITITEYEEIVASGIINKTEVVENDNVTKTLEVIINDDRNELINYKQVTVNDVVTELKAVISNYVYIPGAPSYYDPETGDIITGIPPTSEYVTFATIEYKDLGEEKVLSLDMATTNVLINIKEDEFLFTVTDSEDEGAAGVISAVRTTEGDDVIVEWNSFLNDGTNDLLVFNSVTVNGVVTEAYAAVKGYLVEHEWAWDEVLEEYYVVNTIENYVTWLEVTYTTLEDGTKVLNAVAHDDLNETTEGMDQLTVTIDGDKITGVLYKDEEPLASIELTLSETGLTGEIKDLQNGANTTMALLVIELTEELDAIKNVSLVVNDYEYYYYEDQEPIREIVEIFNGSYEWIDNEEGADNIVIGYNGATYTIGYEITEEGVKLSFADDAENVVVEFAAIQNGDAITLDLLLAVWGMTYVDGAITLSGTEDTVAIAVDIDHLVVYEGYWSTDYIEFEGALQFKLG